MLVPQQTQYAYDTFISYSHVDRAWVWGELLPRLEAAGLKVSIDDRDFEIGVPSLINMERAVDTSRHTLVVLTPAWIASEWTRFESLLVATTDPAGRRRKLLPLLLAHCDLPPRLAMLTYVDFTNPAERARALERLIRSIAPQLALAPPVTKNELTRSATSSNWQQELSASDRTELADLLRRSGRADSSARQALCIEIGIDPDTLDFLTGIAARDFALRLISHLLQTGNNTAMRWLCDAIASTLRGPYAATLIRIRDKLG